MNDFWNKYQQLKQQSDAAVAQNYQNYIFNPVNKNLQDTFSSAVMGATTAPTNGAVAFAQRLAERGRYPQVSLPEYNSLISVAKNTLKIPEKYLKNMNFNDLIAEITGAAENKRFNIKQIQPK